MGLKVSGVHFAYKDKEVLRDISFEVKPGELLGLLGPNGVGKTTLLKCINKIHAPKSGDIFVNGYRIDTLSERMIAHHLSYVPQSAHSNFPITVLDTVMMGRYPFLNFKVTQKDKTIVFNLLERMGLTDMAFRQINRLSGGERQRVFIARAIAQEPKVILLDEPTSNLDMSHQLETLKLLRKTIQENKIAAVMTIHDLNLASMFCDKGLMLKDKKVYAYGTCQDVINEVNIKAVYGVNTEVYQKKKKKHVMLLE